MSLSKTDELMRRIYLLNRRIDKLEDKATVPCTYCHKKTDAHGAYSREDLCKECYERLLGIRQNKRHNK